MNLSVHPCSASSFRKHIHSPFTPFFAIRSAELVFCSEFQNICHKWSPDPPFSPSSSGDLLLTANRILGKSLGQCCPGRAGASPQGPGCSRAFAGRRLAALLEQTVLVLEGFRALYTIRASLARNGKDTIIVIIEQPSLHMSGTEQPNAESPASDTMYDDVEIISKWNKIVII